MCFLKYEDMKRDIRGAINKLANFLGKDLSEETVQKIMDHCSFNAMRDNLNVNMKGHGFYYREKGAFIRRGVVGDWQNHFTVAQNEEFDALYAKSMAGTGLTFES
ncbi:sulfotransferase 1B1-like [Ptychodera flava]|uniref:sulfotransferase 1B1-like n=1 Tax=Ptychodera flava TaxID=63121 RepID=UPI00396A462B